MLKSIFTIISLALITANSSFAQAQKPAKTQAVFYSTLYQGTFAWDSTEKAFEIVKTVTFEGLIEVNPSRTQIKITGDDETTVYFIRKETHDLKEAIDTYEVVSESGHQYTFTFDPLHKMVKRLFYNGYKSSLQIYRLKYGWRE